MGVSVMLYNLLDELCLINDLSIILIGFSLIVGFIIAILLRNQEMEWRKALQVAYKNWGW